MDKFVVTHWDGSEEVCVVLLRDDKITMQYLDGVTHSVSTEHFEELSPQLVQ